MTHGPMQAPRPRLLIVDDDRAILTLIGTIALKEGLSSVLMGPKPGMRCRTESPPLLAIVDWNMPGIDGPTLCRDLCDMPALAGMYVILLTSNTAKADVITGQHQPEKSYLPISNSLFSGSGFGVP